MLKTNIAKTINGSSMVTSGETELVAASMHATISENGSVNINKNIVNKELYDANKDEVRADWAAFDEFVHNQEDTADD